MVSYAILMDSTIRGAKTNSGPTVLAGDAVMTLEILAIIIYIIIVTAIMLTINHIKRNK